MLEQILVALVLILHHAHLSDSQSCSNGQLRLVRWYASNHIICVQTIQLFVTSFSQT